MNASAHSRASTATRQSQSAPVMRVSQLFTDDQLSQARMFAHGTTSAQAVVDYLEPYSKRYSLDATLADVLRTARGTLNRNARFQARMH